MEAMASMTITREDAMSDDVPAYGLWGLVILNSAIFIFFAFIFFNFCIFFISFLLVS